MILHTLGVQVEPREEQPYKAIEGLYGGSWALELVGKTWVSFPRLT